ncbi:amino acid permease-domain-containing protein [Aspergillus welwitschiae]|uniref:Amino acid permease-domain-containing protein n=1 Tax=Aspergillus welwitschiae TaxID=1341132 RepID=A0A3F3Q435_9EURO|nr:amino acid permease-domain-containing protein [Aspergillus welwitschiae]RDH33974.1 amino acid permease-domain-containing protein [Aspergillus welwitschiae]
MEYHDNQTGPPSPAKGPHAMSIEDPPPPSSYQYRGKPRLERYLGFLPMLAFAATLQASWESLGSSLQAGLLNGGPVAIVYGMLLSFAGSLCLTLSMAEMASINPVAAWWANVAVGPYLVGTEIQGLLVQNYPSYNPEGWHGTLLVFAVLFLPLLVNIFARRLLAPVEVLSGVIHILSYPAIMVVMIVLGQRHTNDFVWTEFVTDQSGWHDKGVIYSIGLLTAAFTLSSFDGVIHMSEEVNDAPRAVPRSMVWGLCVNAVLAFGFAIALLYTMGDFQKALDSPTGYPIIEIFYAQTGSKAASSAMMLPILLSGCYSSFNVLASVSRLTWAFARDEGFPFSSFFAHVSPRYKIPLRSLFLVTTITVLIALINIGSSAAFNAVLSLDTLALYISYLVPVLFMLIKRVRFSSEIRYGPFNLGRYGIPINAFAMAYGTYITIFLPWPETQPVTASGMNYGAPVFGVALLFAVIDWFVRGHKKWNGPTVMASPK